MRAARGSSTAQEVGSAAAALWVRGGQSSSPEPLVLHLLLLRALSAHSPVNAHSPALWVKVPIRLMA